jgi:gentisate 1,2-dioxygenase
MFKIELPPGTSTTPQRHMYEEVIFVVEGRGSTQIEFSDGTKRSFEWGPRSLFAIPLNAKHRHFNASGSQRAILTSTSNLPIMMKMFHNERFIFDNDFTFDERMGKEEYYTGDGDLTLVKPGQDMWETNFVPDLATAHVTEYGDRGGDSMNIKFILADGCMHAHISEMRAGTYKKGHRHGPGTHVTCVIGSGYSLLWNDGDKDFERIDWGPGTVFPPADRQFHQHFVTSKEPVRYLATALGSIRYPVTNYMTRALFGVEGQKRQASSLSTKEGGDQIEYEDQDPRIHQIFIEESKKHGLPVKMQKWFPEG